MLTRRVSDGHRHSEPVDLCSGGCGSFVSVVVISEFNAVLMITPIILLCPVTGDDHRTLLYYKY